MGYSEDDRMVRVDFFKPSGKWYCSEAIRWTGSYHYDSSKTDSQHPLDAFAVSLRDNLKARLREMTAVCLRPYHNLSYPLMIKDGGWLNTDGWLDTDDTKGTLPPKPPPDAQKPNVPVPQGPIGSSPPPSPAKMFEKANFTQLENVILELRDGLQCAEAIIRNGVYLMPAEKLYRWTGVRDWLEWMWNISKSKSS